MELKDWIMLIVPLVVDGLLFFTIHEIYHRRESKAERKYNYKIEILVKFKDYLKSFYDSYLDIRLLDKDIAGRNVEFYEVWNPTQAAIEQTILFYISNATSLADVQRSFSDILTKWQHMTDVLSTSRKDNDGRISQVAAIEFCETYSALNESIKKCLSDCEKLILK